MRSAIATLSISLTIALLPIYKRVASLDFSRTSKDNLLLIVFGLFMVLFRDAKRSFPKEGWVVVMVALFLNVVNQHNVLSINAMFQSFYLAAALLFFIKLYECFDIKHEKIILNGMCAGALVQSVFVAASAFDINLDLVLMQVFNNGLNFIGQEPGMIDAVGTLGNTNLFAGYMALCCLAFFREKWIYALPIPLTCLLLSKSAMGIGAFVGGVTYFFGSKYIHSLLFYLLAIVSMFLAYIFGLNGMDSGRFEIWEKLLKMYDYQALIGYGPGWFPDQRLAWSNTILVQEHSMFLSVVSVFGVIGLLALLVVFYRASKTKNKTFASIVFAIFLNGFGHFSFHQSTMVVIIVTVLAISLIKEEYHGIMER